MDDKVFHNYASWLIENSNLFDKLNLAESSLMDRYKHVFDVIQHLYDKNIESEALDDEEFNIFNAGFYYLFEQFDQISLILEHTYNGDIYALDKQAPTIILLLNTIEMENELYEALEGEEEKTKPLTDIEQEILSIIERKEDAPVELYEKLDQVSVKLYDEYGLNFYPIGDIFYDIAGEYDLLEEN